MFEKLKYKRYCKGKKKIRRVLAPDHLADCIDIGHIRKIEFRSGNTYRMRLVEIREDKISTWHSPLYDGVYEMTRDIQPLTYEQFLQLC